MNLNRRQFFKGAAGAAVVVAVSPSLLLVQGCSGSEVEKLLNTVIASGEAILAVAEPDAPWLASLESGLKALQTAEASWVGGGAVALVDDALNTIQGVLAGIPLTAVYSPLVDVLVAGIEAVLAALPSSSVATPSARAANPRIGRVALHKPHLLQTRVGAYKAQFNDTAEALGLAKAKI